MKTLPLCILSFALGCGLTALVLSNRESGPMNANAGTPAAAPARPGSSAEKGKSLATNDKPADVHTAKATKGEEAGTVVAGSPESVMQGVGTFMQNMGPLMEASLKREMHAKAAKLAARLKLSPEQAESLEKMLLAQGKDQAEFVQKSFKAMKENPGDSPKLMEVAQARNDIKAAQAAWAKDNLSSEQQDSLQRYQEERRKANAEKSAQWQLDDMNETLDLSEEQRDQLFQHFAKQSLADGSADEDEFMPFAHTVVGEDGANPAGEPTADPLAAILTPEQLDTYRKHQETERKNNEEMIRAMGFPSGNGGAVEAGAIMVSPGVKVRSVAAPAPPGKP